MEELEGRELVLWSNFGIPSNFLHLRDGAGIVDAREKRHSGTHVMRGGPLEALERVEIIVEAIPVWIWSIASGVVGLEECESAGIFVLGSSGQALCSEGRECRELFGGHAMEVCGQEREQWAVKVQERERGVGCGKQGGKLCRCRSAPFSLSTL
jgi:hypothetical protein